MDGQSLAKAEKGVKSMAMKNLTERGLIKKMK